MNALRRDLGDGEVYVCRIWMGLPVEENRKLFLKRGRGRKEGASKRCSGAMQKPSQKWEACR